MMYTSIGFVSSSSRKRFPCWSWCIGKNGFVPGTRRNLPSSSLPPAAVPVVSPSMKNAAACGPSSRATAGITFSLRFRISRKCGLLELRRVGRLDLGEREDGTAVLGVALVEEVDVAAVVLADVLEVRARLGDGAVDRRLVLGAEGVGLGEAAGLGRAHRAVGPPGDEVVLHGQRSVLARERRRGLAGARKADDQADPVARSASESPCSRRAAPGRRDPGRACSTFAARPSSTRRSSRS